MGNSNYFATIQCYCATNKEVVDCFCHNATNCVSDNQNNQQNSNDRQIYYFCFARSSYYKQKRGLSTKTLLVCLPYKWCGLVAVLAKTCVEFFAKIVAKQRALCLQNVGKTNENFLQFGGKKCYRKPCVLPCIGRQGAEILLQNRLLKGNFVTLQPRVCKLAHFWAQGATFWGVKGQNITTW